MRESEIENKFNSFKSFKAKKKSLVTISDDFRNIYLQKKCYVTINESTEQSE